MEVGAVEKPDVFSLSRLLAKPIDYTSVISVFSVAKSFFGFLEIASLRSQ